MAYYNCTVLHSTQVGVMLRFMMVRMLTLFPVFFARGILFTVTTYIARPVRLLWLHQPPQPPGLHSTHAAHEIQMMVR